jgi:hypothetical protein
LAIPAKRLRDLSGELLMEPIAATKAGLAQRARHELIEYFAISAYLYVCFGAIIFFKASVLHSRGVVFAAMGIALAKALILGKFIFVAHTLKFGERSKMDRPISEILRKAVLFVLLLIVLSVAEEVIVGLFHGRATMTSIGDMADGYLPEAFAIGLLMLLILIPYFAFREIGATLGDGKLLRMLTERHRQIVP